MKRFYQHELEDLRTKLILIGEKANEVARTAIDGFLDSDLEKVKQAIILDDAIDTLEVEICLLYTSPSPRDLSTSRMPSSA